MRRRGVAVAAMVSAVVAVVAGLPLPAHALNLGGVYAGSGREYYTSDGVNASVVWRFPRIVFTGTLPLSSHNPSGAPRDDLDNFAGIFTVKDIAYGGTFPVGSVPPCMPPLYKDPTSCLGLVTNPTVYSYFMLEGSFPLHGTGFVGAQHTTVDGTCGGVRGLAHWMVPTGQGFTLICDAHVTGGPTRTRFLIQGTGLLLTAAGNRGANVAGLYTA